uniref:Uncharacterized protein n=1 Tax=Ciona savignyi TaxID=51511 RepID=H2Y4M4_CIOSA
MFVRWLVWVVLLSLTLSVCKCETLEKNGEVTNTAFISITSKNREKLEKGISLYGRTNILPMLLEGTYVKDLAATSIEGNLRLFEEDDDKQSTKGRWIGVVVD